MEEVEKEEMDKAAYSFLCWILTGFVIMITPGTVEMNWAVAIMCWFAGFLHLLRFRYRKYDRDIWAEEIMENVSLAAFAVPGVLLGLYFYSPIGFLIMCLTSIIGMTILFALWRLFLEDLIHGFWW